MKKIIYTLTITIFIAGTILTSCHSSAKKIDDAKNNVAEANQDLNQAIKDSIQQFKKESEEKISAHEKSITDFKARIENEKKENKAIYEKKLAELEQKNTDMKKRLDDYKAENKEKWENFKAEYSKDMDLLNKSFKDLMDRTF